MRAELCNDRRSSRGDKFERLVDLRERNPFQNLQGGGAGNWKAAVSALNPAFAVVQLGHQDRFNSELLKSHAYRDYIDDRVERTDLVKLHIRSRHAVNLSFRLGDPLKHGKRVLPDKRREIAARKQLPDLPMGAPMSMRVVVGVMGMHLIAMVVIRKLVDGGFLLFCRRYISFIGMDMIAVTSMFMVMVSTMLVVMVSLVLMLRFLIAGMAVGCSFVNGKPNADEVLACFALHVHVEIAKIELREFPFDGGGFYPEIDQCADRHVAADAREAI